MILKNIQTNTISATDVGLVRKINEDFCGISETSNGLLCVVCDGMGGHAGGAEASRIATNCIIQYFNKEAYSDIRQALKNALDFANLQIIGTAIENPEFKGMGTTACMLLLKNNEAWIAHVGDSRIYLYVAKEKRLYRLTKDHSYVQGLVDKGIIYEEEIENHPDRNRILKALGIKEDLQAEIAEHPVLPAKGDVFLICSDGLSGMVPDKQIQAILSKKISLEEQETALMSTAKAAGGLDNITFQLIKMNQSPYKKSIFESRNTSSSGVKKNHKLQKYTVLAIIVVAVLLLPIFLSQKYKQGMLETPTVPCDSTIIINQQDSIVEIDTIQPIPTTHNTDSI
ncbi:Stp1/IreP family PP2C-type Ser/Thr phosphatase [Bacteroidales bacterium OttesenSCG-928-M06]|nr:Stp1/IreP family PP2C-type Ser/Thr phosphatase [Bacteroidales bacterium OttesenSCG-928-M06]